MDDTESKEEYPEEGYPEYYRQLDFFNPGEHRHRSRITIIGAGGIGSWTAVLLAKMGIRKLTVYDADVVSPHNLSTTCYTQSQLGMGKVDALAEVIESMTGITITKKRRQYKGEVLKTDILISAVDSAVTRKVLFEAALIHKIPFFVDGRIGGENLRVYALRPQDENELRGYLESLPKPGFESPLPCTGQQVIDVGLTTASLIVRAVRQYLAEGLYNFEIIGKIGEFEWIVSEFSHVEANKPRME